MLETVDFSKEDLPKDEYKRRRDELTTQLVVLQQQARQQNEGLVVLFEGWNGAGKGSRISDLMYNLDARATSVHVTENLDVDQAHEFERQKQGVTGYFPTMQEFWQSLGQRGAITFYDRGWYTTALQQVFYSLFGSLSLPQKLEKQSEAAEYFEKSIKGEHSKQRRFLAAQAQLNSIADFERQLVDDGYAVVKFFVHMTKKGQKKRLMRLYEKPATRWRVSEEKLARVGNYEEAYVIYDKLLEGSDFDYAPWILLNGENKRQTNVAVAEALVNALQRALSVESDSEAEAAAKKAQENSAAAVQEVSSSNDEPQLKAPVTPPQESAEDVIDVASSVDDDVAQQEAVERQAQEQSTHAPAASRFSIVPDYPRLEQVDHTLTLDSDRYRQRLKQLQKRLNTLENEMYQKRVPLIIMYEGWDAAGKGGNIKRVAQALDARAYTIFPSPAPTRPELLHPHLWRYWTRLPKAGHVGMYDRSWYGRVLVERVEGFATPQQWSRAYDEINAFERDLVEWGTILLKFWVDVSPEEQLRRFYERQNDPTKQWKITEEDWRNRQKYPLYKAAVEDMFRLTSTSFAPWTVLESDDKRYARVKALEIIVASLEARL